MYGVNSSMASSAGNMAFVDQNSVILTVELGDWHKENESNLCLIIPIATLYSMYLSLFHNKEVKQKK